MIILTLGFHSVICKQKLFQLINKPEEYIRRKENITEVNQAILLLEDNIKESIKKIGLTKENIELYKLNEKIKINTRLLSGLVIIWTENLIKWLLYEHGAFQDEQIQKILEVTALKDKWIIALTNAFYFTYSNSAYDLSNPIVRKSQIISSSTIHRKDKDKYLKLRQIIESNLSDAIAIRNKIQHGDWVNSYTKSDTSGQYEYDPLQTNVVSNENVLILKLKRKQFKLLYDLIKDLAVFKNRGAFKLDSNSTPFIYFYGKRYGQILTLQKTIDNSSFEIYKNQLITRKKRGEIWKKKNSKSLLIILKRLTKKIRKYLYDNNKSSYESKRSD